jgi:hypothetical protein
MHVGQSLGFRAVVPAIVVNLSGRRRDDLPRASGERQGLRPEGESGSGRDQTEVIDAHLHVKLLGSERVRAQALVMSRRGCSDATEPSVRLASDLANWPASRLAQTIRLTPLLAVASLHKVTQLKSVRAKAAILNRA